MKRSAFGIGPDPSPCHPARPNVQCDICTRYRKAPAPTVDKRRRMVFDASAIAVGTVCPMLSVQPGVVFLEAA